MENESLENLGEFRLLNEVVLPTIRNIAANADLGDDCSFADIPATNQVMVVTTDVGPKPLVWSIGFECYRTWGWYTVACNASDLAAAAAEPFAFSSSVEAPNSMQTVQIKEFFEGLGEACTEFGLKIVGGNLRSAERFAAHGTAIGLTRKKPVLRRSGANPGDYIVVLGNYGEFISTYLKARRGGMHTIDSHGIQVLTRPRPQTRSMIALKALNLISAASDNSDGILGAVWNICERSCCSAEIEMLEDGLPKHILLAAKMENLNPWNIAFFWGDYSIVATVHSNAMSEFIRAAQTSDTPYHVLGRTAVGPPALFGLCGAKKYQLRVLRNENFVRQGFNSDLRDHVNYMLKSDLLAK
jgi:thiamine-monophosphate kinase